MLKMPIGIRSFSRLRSEGYVYVDKTNYLIDLIDGGRAYFVSRPDRFGKSLAISALDALFSDKRDLFDGLYGRSFFDRHDYAPSPVVHLQMSETAIFDGPDGVKKSIINIAHNNAERLGVRIVPRTPAEAISQLVDLASEKYGAPPAVLVDDFDRPLLESVNSPELVKLVREILLEFYAGIAASGDSTRFVFIAGVSRDIGLFPSMEGLKDISCDPRYAAMFGFTEDELSIFMDSHIQETSSALEVTKERLISRMRNYYAGYSFLDGRKRLFNPLSVLNFFQKREFRNYWFESAAPSFLMDYVKRRGVEAENFRGIEFDETVCEPEMENASPDCFLLFGGYLSVRERNGVRAVLDYPNKEVLSSFAKFIMYAKLDIPSSGSASVALERALSKGGVGELIEIYDKLLMVVPEEIYESQERKYGAGRNSGTERLAVSFFHSLLFTLLWAARVKTKSESLLESGVLEATKNNHNYIIALEVAGGDFEKAADALAERIRSDGKTGRYRRFNESDLAIIVVDEAARRVATHRTDRAVTP
ncbi:MAG: AAA family ATPase [Synergistaceae bacterium]|jgi:hypothetical protein|nr:AAA family ATPase [Synergistaceae bacterium]